MVMRTAARFRIYGGVLRQTCGRFWTDGPRHTSACPALLEDDDATIDAVAAFVASRCRTAPGIVVHTGAGISAAAGIATYREAGIADYPTIYFVLDTTQCTIQYMHYTRYTIYYVLYTTYDIRCDR